jgi:hypothetical protein
MRATRYVTPFREGGSLPALVEGDDLGLYVVKFRGAGQGPLALVAEIIAGEIGRKLGLNVPELVLALDFLPGSVMFDPAAGDVAEPDLASAVVWFDGFVTNVDRTARNPNLLCWHKSLYLIDHGAALYFHHDWKDPASSARSRFPAVRDHVLLPWAAHIEEVDKKLRAKLSQEVFSQLLADVPDDWLLPEPGIPTPADKRKAYVEYLDHRLSAASLFVEEAVGAHSALL